MDRFLLGNVPTVFTLVAAIVLVNLAPHVAPVTALTLTGVAALLAGLWCAANFWRCHHAHCLVTGTGWLVLAILAAVEVAVGHSVIAGEEPYVFTAIFVVSLAFEFAWVRTRGTRAVGSPAGGPSAAKTD